MNLPKIKITILTVCLLSALAFVVSHYATNGTMSAERDNNAAGKQVKEIEGYKNWTKVNSAPQLMPARLSNLCGRVFPSTPSNIEVDGPGNPHRDKYITVYVNDVGQKAMLNQRNPKFPEGSVIVKEKLSDKDSQTPELLTVMIKQKKDFNPASGDWEYMVVDGTGTRVEARGELKSCQGCHIARQKTGYIFRTYLCESVREELK